MTNRLLNLVWGLFLFLLILYVFPTRSSAQTDDQVHATGSNLLRAGAGSTTDPQGNESDKRYLEEIADLRLFYQYLSVGLRYEMDDPSEVGRSYTDRNFRRRWITYNKDQANLTAGDFPALFGRGLAVNLFESRPLNYDSWLDGFYGKTGYDIPKQWTDLNASVSVKALAGLEDFYPIDTTLPVMHISARAANGEFGLFDKRVTVGASFLQAFTGTSQPGPFNSTFVTSREVNQPDVYADINSGDFEAYGEWTQDRTHVNQLLSTNVDTNHTGNAFYMALSYSNSFLGLTFDYKNYSYFLHAPGDAYTNVFSKLPISSPPEVYKDFTFTSITRTTHSVNFDDEVGYQLEANITAIPEWVIDLDAAASSSHDKYNVAGLAVDSTGLLPRITDQGFYPFWEAYAEAEWDFDPNNEENFVKFAIHRRSDVITYNPASPSATDYRYATTVAAKFQYETRPNQSFLGIIEHQWAYDASLITKDKRRLNELVTLQYSFDPVITFGVIFDYGLYYDNRPITIDNDLFSGWNLHLWGNAEIGHMPEFFTSLRMGQSHWLLLQYGAERGGLNCTGGICRVVPPFNGLRVTLTSQI